jgi:hypothetical protein
MRKRRNFVPSCPQTLRLEERVVLNGGGNQVATSVLLQGLNGPARGFRAHAAPATAALINLAFQSFQQDFRAVRATYLAAVVNGTATQADTQAFQNYTIQRTNLLAQQVTNSFLLYNPGVTRGPNVDSPLPLIVFGINGVKDRRSMPRQQYSPLVTQLTGYSPDMVTTRSMAVAANTINPIPGPGASATTIALDTIAQDNAIEATLVATLNSVTIVRNGNFGNGNSHH